MNQHLMQWALRNRVSAQALEELRNIFGMGWPSVEVLQTERASEAAVQAAVRLEAPKRGVTLWRNNVGVLMNADGVPVRYGLANDSPRLNKVIKSGDLIGWRPILIGPEHIGSTIAQFVSRECKRPGWSYTGNEHEQAQMKWIAAVLKDGGDAKFCTGEGTL